MVYNCRPRKICLAIYRAMCVDLSLSKIHNVGIKAFFRCPDSMLSNDPICNTYVVAKSKLIIMSSS